MTRGIRGATTVLNNSEEEILTNTSVLVKEMIENNKIHNEDVSHVFISVTEDLNATFPAKVLRQMAGWAFVPVMCMQEINVPAGLDKCIRIMMVVNTNEKQEAIKHTFHNEAVKLRPDLIRKNGE